MTSSLESQDNNSMEQHKLSQS